MIVIMLIVVLLVFGLVPAFGKDLTIGFMDDHSAWGKVDLDTQNFKEGTSALKWSAGGAPIQRTGLSIQPADYHSLRLWVYSEKATFERIELSLLNAQNKPLAALTFRVDWAGWNRMELPPERFTTAKVGDPIDWADMSKWVYMGREIKIDWTKVKGIKFTRLRPGYGSGALTLDGLELSTDYPKIYVNDHEEVIDWLYWGGETAPYWKPTEETLKRPAGSFGFNPYWTWGEIWMKEDNNNRDICAYTREFNADLTGYDTLEFHHTNDAQGYLSIHWKIDGEWSTPVKYEKGTGKTIDLQIPIPEGSKRLEAVTIDISEPKDATGGDNGRIMVCNAMWLLLRKTGTPIGEIASELPEIKPIPLQGTLEKDGFAAGVYFNKEELASVRHMFMEGTVKDLGAGIISKADEYLTAEPEKMVGDYYTGMYWIASRDIAPRCNLGEIAYNTALAYVLTGDKKYADMARRAMLASTHIKAWTDSFYCRYPLGWGAHGRPLTESSVTHHLGLAYEWAYTALTPDERRQMEDALIEKGIKWSYDRISDPAVRGMNQGIVFGSEIGVTLLALEPHRPEVKPLREQVTKWMLSAISDYSLPDGDSSEGSAYWAYTMSTAVNLLAALGRKDPGSLHRQLAHKVQLAMDWLIYLKSNRDDSSDINWNDCGSGTYMPPASVAAFMAKYLHDPTAAWFMKKYSGPNDMLSAFMWDGAVKAKEPVKYLAKHFRGTGHTMLREGFEIGDGLVTMITGPFGGGHYHADRPAFTFEAYAKPLAMDPGMISYSDPEANTLDDSRIHNTVTLDGANVSDKTKTTKFFSSSLLDYVEVEGAKAYKDCSKYVRKLIYLRPKTLVVSDDMQLNKPHRIEWNINSCVDLSLNGNRLLGDFDGIGLAVDFAGADQLSMEKEITACLYPDSRNNHRTVYASQQSLKQRFMAALRPTKGESNKLKPAKSLSGKGFQGMEMSVGSDIYIVLESTGGPIKANSVECDGEIAAIKLSRGKLTGAAVISGTKLTCKGQQLISTDHKGNFSIDYLNSTASLQAPVGTKVTFIGQQGKTPGKVLIGRMQKKLRPADAVVEGNGVTIKIPTGKAPPEGYQVQFD